MNELIKYFEALEARLAAQDERIAKLESSLAEKIALLEQMRESLEAMAKLSEDANKNLLEIHRLIAEGIQVSPEPEVDVELVYPEDEEATVELPEEEEAASAEPTEQTEVELVAEPQPVVEPAPVVEPEPQPEAPDTPEQPESPVTPEAPATPVTPEPQPEPQPVHQPEAPRAPQQTSLFGAAVTDIRQAVSIGDRFLFQRELFGGNAEKLQQTLTELNALHSFDEAVALIDRFGWDKQSPTYELFLNVLHRRFQ